MGTGSSSYGSGGYEDEYGGKKCYPTYETKHGEQCEDYHEKVCYTSHKEKCEDVQGKKCKAIKSSKHERKCYDVTELLCSLKENVQYEEIPAVFTVQKCHNIQERVCDTVYETELTERDDFKCVPLRTLIAQLRNTQFMIKLAEHLFTLIAKLKDMERTMHMLVLILKVMVAQTMLLKGMVVLNMLQNTNAREIMKPNVTQLHVPFPQNIVKIEKRKYVKS